MLSESPKTLVPKFFDNTAKTYDKVVLWTTFGKDRYWKNEILKHISHANAILDLACGTGILTKKLTENFPDAKVIGVDITKSYLETAKKNLQDYNNVQFIHQDAESLNLNTKFDCITSSYIPKYCDAEIIVKNCINHLNNDGKIILHDFIYPRNLVVQKLWNIYFVLLGFIGAFTPSWKNAFSELPKLIRSTTWLNDYTNAMKKYDLDVECKLLTWNSSAILCGTKTN